MQKIRSWTKWLFTGLRLFLPLIPKFVWIALRKMAESTIDYWKGSEAIVQEIADEYKKESTNKKIASEYDVPIYWVCYSIASFLYLLGWLVQAWLTVKILQMLVLAIL